MFVQALAQYADTFLSEALHDVAWEQKPVPYLIELDSDGRFLGVQKREMPVVRGKKTISMPLPLSIPRSPVARVSGHHPLLAADFVPYVLGVGPWTNANEKDKHTNHHHAYLSLIGKAAEATGDEALGACARFYGRPEEVERAREALMEAKSGTLVALSVGGPVVLRSAVRSYWSQHYNERFQERVGDKTGECLISGKFGPFARTNEKIKGTASLGGQPAGVSLMSFDKDAFRSYGWDQNENSPVAPDRAMAYVLALNDLLRSDKGHRRDLAGVGFIFWLKEPVEFDPFLALDQPDTEQVNAMLALDPGADPNRNAFYLAGLSGNGGRLRVLYWVTDSLENIKRNLRSWHNGLRVAGFGDMIEPVRFWQLRQAIHRDGVPQEKQVKHRVIALLRRALEGPSQPLGYPMLASALGRLRRLDAGEWPPALLGLVRMCVNDVIHFYRKDGKGNRPMEETLDSEQRNPAYLCGRLLAEYDGLQRSAAGQSKVNQSVADRYYSLASTCPQIAFPRIEDLGNKHLRKLRRDRPGAAVAIDRRLQELHGLLEEAAGYRFPDKLNLEDQGRFALGYQHQRSHSFAEARARKERSSAPAPENQDQEGQEE